MVTPSRNPAAMRVEKSLDTGRVLRDAQEVIRRQSDAIAELASRLDDRYAQALAILQAAQGHVAVVGVGKSGLVGRKIASTLSSTGTPAFFISAAEAHHGDLGAITSRDCAIIISYSGETSEIVTLLPHLRRFGIPMIGLVGDMNSTVARSVDVALDVSVRREVCPNNLAPTNSTLAALAMGDVLAVSLIRSSGFDARDFARFHPGGALGAKLHENARVKDAMRCHNLPTVSPADTVAVSLEVMTEGHLGLVLVVTGGKLVGLVTDGDLRRAMQRFDSVRHVLVSEIMTLNPVTVQEDTPLAAAHQRMKHMKLKALVVVSREGKVEGVVDVFDEP